MRGELCEQLARREVPDALRVPTDALVREGQGWAVFRIERGRARLRPVRVDVGDDHYRVVVEGMDAGDRVILGGRAITVLTGELPFLNLGEKVEIRIEKPRREKRALFDRKQPIPRYGFRSSMRGLK